MTTTTPAAEPKLTAKQQEVIKHLRDGKDVAWIAKRFGITGSGVYGHMRNIRKAGITLPGETMNGGTPPAPSKPAPAASKPAAEAAPQSPAVPSPTVEVGDPAATLRAAIEQSNARAQAVAEEIASLNAHADALRQEGESLSVKREKYEAALKALA